MRKLNMKECYNIVFNNNAELYAFFPSKLEDSIALIGKNHCVIKKNGQILIYDKYEGIEEAINELCKD